MSSCLVRRLPSPLLQNPWLGSSTGLPIDRPPIFIEEFATSILQRNIWNQLVRLERQSRQGITPIRLDMLEQADALKRNTCRGNDRIVHNLESDRVDEPVGDNLCEAC